MRTLFIAFCGLVHILDRIFVYTVGRKVQYRERLMPLSEDSIYEEDSFPVYNGRTRTLYAIYEVPNRPPDQFGIDLDEMIFEFDYTAVCEKVVMLTIGSILTTEDGSKWRIVERRLKDHKYFGPGRFIAVGQRFVLSKTRSEAECKQEN